VFIQMTLTAPGCPVAGVLPGHLAKTVAQVEGVGRVEVEIVWDPPWTPEYMTDAARLELNMF
jgi:metal-sulfur cluster biosynthetic enzyme